MATLGRATTAAHIATPLHPIRTTLGGLLAAGWALALIDAFVVNILTPKAQLVLLSALVAGTVVLTRWHLVGGETIYKAFEAGRNAEARERRSRDVGHG